MGFNTVAIVLNDMLDCVRKSPHQVAWILSNAPMGHIRPSDQAFARHRLQKIAEENNEPLLPEQAVVILPTFHADSVQYLRAGGNALVPLKFLRFGKDKATGQKTVTLLLPEWDQD